MVLALSAIGFGGVDAMAEEPRLNQIQVIGSHNSYHLAPHPNVLGLIAVAGRDHATGLEYTHKPLAEQFSELKIRQIELDVFADPDGGRYAEPSARKILKGLGKDAGPDPNEGGILNKPGLKVFHVQDIDYRSTAPTLVDALRQVRAWSKGHPRHVPILILLELKDGKIAALPTQPAPFTKTELDGVDKEILSVFERGEILTPDDVRGAFSTLPEAIQKRGWPKLSEVRGKVMFALDNEGKHRTLYLEGHEALQDRLMFVSVPAKHPAAAWMKINDAIGDYDRIVESVRAGFIVRTRADANTVEARKNDTNCRDKALSSGAQFVSTDYAEPRPDFSPYHVRHAGGIAARSNPVSGDPSQAGVDLEGPVGNGNESSR